MLKIISSLILRLYGWKIQGKIPADIKKCVIIQAPHTSYSDFFIGWHASNVLNVKFRFMIKQEAFKFPLGGLLKRCGGVPVDRGKAQNTIRQMLGFFKKEDTFYLVVTPEGTRQLNHNWKKGFYTIATAAQVPILFGFVDYKHKICGLSDIVLYPTGDFEKDFEIIKKFYTGINAKYPEHYNLTK